MMKNRTMILSTVGVAVLVMAAAALVGGPKWQHAPRPETVVKPVETRGGGVVVRDVAGAPEAAPSPLPEDAASEGILSADASMSPEAADANERTPIGIDGPGEDHARSAALPRIVVRLADALPVSSPPSDGELDTVDTQTSPEGDVLVAEASGEAPALEGESAVRTMFGIPVVEHESLPDDEDEAQAVALGPRTLTLALERGETLSGLLARADIENAEIHRIVTALSPKVNMRALREGQSFELGVDFDGERTRFERISLRTDGITTVEARRDGERIVATETTDAFQNESRVVAVTIRNSIYADLQRAGVESSVVSQAIRLLSHSLDLQREVRPDDMLEIVYDREVAESGASRGGDIQAIRFRNARGVARVELYRFGTGRNPFFGPDGAGINRGLLRTPIDGARISSRFGMRRHPILGFTRLHAGVDFAAPTGTPIFAAGDGKITFMGPNGGYGNFIKIRHNDQVSTAYAHLSRFARGLRDGATVSQGDLIGYVGSTGLSSGPHLHYEVHVAGRPVDPLTVQSINSSAVASRELQDFKRTVDRMRSKFAQNTTTTQ